MRLRMALAPSDVAMRAPERSSPGRCIRLTPFRSGSPDDPTAKRRQAGSPIAARSRRNASSRREFFTASCRGMDGEGLESV